jgi:hypothetical protein
MHAMRAAIFYTLGSNSGISHTIMQRTEHLINEHLIRGNQKHCRYVYVPEQRVLKKKWKPRKLGERTSGPYRVLQRHVNGTFTIALRPGYLRETQHKKGYAIQRTHSHIITYVQFRD